MDLDPEQKYRKPYVNIIFLQNLMHICIFVIAWRTFSLEPSGEFPDPGSRSV